MRVAVVISTVAVAGFLGAGRPVHAQGGCGVGALDAFVQHPDVVAIFRGVVTALKAVANSLTFPRDRREIATMTVTRVWKGSLASTTALHRWFTEGRDSGSGFQIGKEYVAIAHELNADARKWFQLPTPGERALGVNGWGACSVMPIDSPSATRLIGDAPGYPPKP